MLDEMEVRSNKDSCAAIICTDVLEDISGYDLSLDCITTSRKAIVPGRSLDCLVPNAANLTAIHTRYMDLTHVRSFTPRSLPQVLEARRGGGRSCGDGSEWVFSKDVRTTRLDTQHHAPA